MGGSPKSKPARGAPRKTVPKVNLTRIARETGVNLSTVSRILRDEPGYTFAEETKAKVLAVAEKYRYRSNLLVRGLVTGRSMTVGVVVPGNGFYGDILKGIHDRLFEANMGLLLAWNEGNLGEDAIAIEKRLLSNLVERRVDGIILRPVHDDAREAYFREVLDRKLPLVTVDRRLSGMDVDFSGTDDEAAGSQAAEHLHSLGHRDVLLVNFSVKTEPARLRQRGFVKRAEALGMKTTCLEESAKSGDLTEEMADMLRPPSKITAVFATTTPFLTQLYALCPGIGRFIPRDLSIIGMMEESVALLMDPPVTTLRQNPRAIGAKAAELLLGRLDGHLPDAIQVHREGVELMVRGSTGPAKAGRA